MSGSIVDLINLETGEHIDGNQYLQQERGILVRARTRLTLVYKTTPDKLWLVCAYCGSPVLIACMNNFEQKFFFKHYPSVENDPQHQCIHKTKSKLTKAQINAMKYNGAKESLPHRELKEHLRLSLLADPNVSNIALEKVQKSTALQCWRKPDVSATYKTEPMVFEAQLSTTFLSVIVERKIFYEAQQAFLVWIFNQFDPTETLIRQSVQDIYYNNNSNAFVVNSETVAASCQSKEFMVDCYYIEPSLEEATLSVNHCWRKIRVGLSQLTFNHVTKQIYFFDYETARKKIDETIQSIRQKNEFKKQAEREFQRQQQSEWQTQQDQKRLDALMDKMKLREKEEKEMLAYQKTLEDKCRKQARLDAALHEARTLAESITKNSLEYIFCDDQMQLFLEKELKSFEYFWRKLSQHDYTLNPEMREEWELIRGKLKVFNIETPEHIFHTPYKTLVNSMLSAKYGYPFGTKQTSLISVAHVLIENCPQFLLQFRLVLKHCGTYKKIKDDGRWAAKVEKHKNNSEKTDHSHDAFIEFLVPQFRGRLVSMGQS